jgi:hypothetical protein
MSYFLAIADRAEIEALRGELSDGAMMRDCSRLISEEIRAGGLARPLLPAAGHGASQPPYG